MGPMVIVDQMGGYGMDSMVRDHFICMLVTSYASLTTRRLVVHEKRFLERQMQCRSLTDH